MNAATKTGSTTNSRRQIQPATIAFVSLVVVYLLVFAALSLRRYASVRADIDLSIYSQVVWNTAFGQPFRTSVLPFTENYLGNHFTPIMAVFAPVYLVWADPRVLLLAQVLAGALGAVALYLFAREQLPTPWAAVLLAAAFLAYPALQHQTVTDFHGVALGTAAVMWAYYALLCRHNLLLIGLLPVMLLIREDLALIIIMMGVYAFFIQRRRRLGLGLFLLGLAASVLVIMILIPAFRGGRVFHYNDYYDYLGGSPLSMLRTIVLSPGTWLPRALHLPKVKLLVQLLLPVAFLPLLVPSIFLLGASALAYLLLVDYPFWPIYTLEGQYQALLIPFILMGTVLGVERLAGWLDSRWDLKRLSLAASGLVLVLCLVTSVLWGPLANEVIRAEFRVDEQSLAERALLDQIPPDAGVVADDRFASYLSTREGFFILGGLYEYDYPIDYMIYEDTPVGFPAEPPARLEASGAGGWPVPRWELLGSSGLTELRRKNGTVGAAPLPNPPVFEGGVALRGATGYGGPLAAAPGEPLEVALVWENQGLPSPGWCPFLPVDPASGRCPVPLGIGQPRALRRPVPHRPVAGRQPGGRRLCLDLPPWLAPGEDIELHAGLYAREGQQRLNLTDGATTIVAGTVVVAEPPPLAEDHIPEIPIEVGLPLAEGFQLYGKNPILEQSTAGGLLDVTLYWRATAAMEQSFQVRFELLGEGQSVPVATWQRPPGSSDSPTSDWQPGTIVAGWYPLSLPPDLSPGRYDLFVVADGGEGPAGQPVRLVTVQIGGGG